MERIIIYSHGFGVRKDDNGLLTDVANYLPEFKSILFDYNEFDSTNNTLTIRPLSKQAEILNEVINTTHHNYPESEINLICHSQGVIVAALANPKGITKTILLTPVFDMDLERRLKKYSARPGVEMNLEGISRIPSSNGIIRLIPSEYWHESNELDLFALYNAFAQQTEIIAILANQDDILPRVDLQELSSKIKIISLDGNHGFGGAGRTGLLQAIRKILV